MDLTMLRKALSVFRDKDGSIKNVSEELLKRPVISGLSTLACFLLAQA